VEVLQKNRMTCVLWNAIPRDWEDPAGWVDTALDQCRARPWTLLVLHDLPTRAMENLQGFITRARGQGVEFRQDFPPQCVLIRQGQVIADLGPYVQGHKS
jgi:hypothetical protein